MRILLVLVLYPKHKAAEELLSQKSFLRMLCTANNT